MRAWWRWRRELRRLRREQAAAYVRWRRASYTYDDLAALGLWRLADRAMAESKERHEEFSALRQQFERMEQVGP
jgi:hypothetical protein